MKDKAKLKKFVQIIGDLLKIEGNEWLVDEILKTIGKVSTVEEIAKHSLIQNIHEYCVEQKIHKQATDFYGSFPIDEEVKKQLIADYKKMEHERRRDDFENFCLCVYQQIENITNYLFKKEIAPKWHFNKNKIAHAFSDGKVLTQNDLIIGSAKDWYANVKFKALLFYFYFNEKISNIIPFNERVGIFEELYQVRNQNHRGGTPTEYQRKTLDKIKGNEAKYYFKFYGFLQDLITKLEMTLSNTKNEVQKSEIKILSSNSKLTVPLENKKKRL